MGKGPHYEGKIRATVDRLAGKRPPWTAKDVLEELRRLFPEAVGGPNTPGGLNVRTVGRWLETRKGEPSTPWSSADPDADPAAVLAVLDAVLEKSPGVTITTAEAQAITMIRRAVPLMPPAVVYLFGQDYCAAAAARDVADLDVSLAYARRVLQRSSGGFYMDPASIAAHVKRHVDQWIARPLTFWSGSEAGGAAYVQALGAHASAVKRSDGRHHYLADEGDHGFTWYDSSGFGRLVIDTGRGPL